MKKTFAICILGLIFNAAIAQDVTIKGTFTNNQSDSVVIESFSKSDMTYKKFGIKPTGDFQCTFRIVSAGYFKLGIDQTNYVVLVIHPGDKIEVTADAQNLFGSAKIRGSVSSELFYSANFMFASFQAQKDSLKAESERQAQLLVLKEETYAVNFIKQNPKSLVSLMMAEKANKEEYYDVLFMLDSCLYLEYPANKMVQDFHAEVSKMKFMKVGTPIPDITLKDKHGKKISLKSLRGKVVLVDFWATWCGPCKAEIPNIKRIYTTFKDKGFDIYSISIDRSFDQWVAGSTDLVWNSVFDEGGVVATEFNVTSIPLMILIDKNGNIVAKNLRGNQLYLKVSDMMEETSAK